MIQSSFHQTQKPVLRGYFEQKIFFYKQSHRERT